MVTGKDAELAKFAYVVEADRQRYLTEGALLQWLFVDRLYARNERVEMNFYGFDGDTHLQKFFNWQKKLEITDYLPSDLIRPLIEVSVARDRDCLSRLGLSVSDQAIESIARYNAQDYLFQRFYPVPQGQQPRVVLDFGAGFGRAANLVFGAPDSATRLLIAIDAIPGPYLTQRVYYKGLQLRLADYIDCKDEFDFARNEAVNQVIHLPTWRMDIVPTESVDLISCVQVLKELPEEVLLFALRNFARTLKPRGALYIRDHVQFHHPNQMPVDELLQAAGFVLEFRPLLRDRSEIHGLPRVWRKLDPALYVNARPGLARKQHVG